MVCGVRLQYREISLIVVGRIPFSTAHNSVPSGKLVVKILRSPVFTETFRKCYSVVEHEQPPPSEYQRINCQGRLAAT